MEIIGIICEYNPFHNGHVYHLEKIKELYPDSIIVLALNGYFMQRGEIGVLTKEDKVKLSLMYGVDIVIELPFIYGTQSADTFAYRAIESLNKLKVNRIVFGSETNDIEKLKLIAKTSLTKDNDDKVKELLDKGYNYPTALAKALNIKFEFKPNDLLAISYIKAILQINPKIEPISIQRTNDYLDLESSDDIISASNIRNKLKANEDISKYVPSKVVSKILNVNEDLLFKYLSLIIKRNDDLSKYLDVDEGIEYRLIKALDKSHSLNELIESLKTKRYTYNKLNRMLIHILIGVQKKDAKTDNDYLNILGFNKKGQKYLKDIRKEIPESNKSSIIRDYEKKAAFIYDLIMNTNTYKKELENKPIIL